MIIFISSEKVSYDKGIYFNDTYEELGKILAFLGIEEGESFQITCQENTNVLVYNPNLGQVVGSNPGDIIFLFSLERELLCSARTFKEMFLKTHIK